MTRSKAASRITAPRVTLLAAAVLASLGVALYAYAAALPAPTITSHPSDPTTRAGASFTFTASATITRFECALDASSFTNCGTTRPSTKKYSDLSDGSHTFSVRAVSGSQRSSATSFTWTIDTIPPPTPVLTQHPSNPSPSTTVTFAWTDSEPHLRFACEINDHGQSCSSPFTFTFDNPDTGEGGANEFTLWAVDGAGNRSGAVEFFWRVSAPTDHFTISGNVDGLLPGVWRSLQVAITNPNAFDLQVTQLTVDVATSPAGCSASSNIQFQPSPISSTHTVTVPAHSTVTLAAADQPQIQLIDLPTVNQDACKNQSFGLQYTGTATHP